MCTCPRWSVVKCQWSLKKKHVLLGSDASLWLVCSCWLLTFRSGLGFSWHHLSSLQATGYVATSTDKEDPGVLWAARIFVLVGTLYGSVGERAGFPPALGQCEPDLFQRTRLTCSSCGLQIMAHRCSDVRDLMWSRRQCSLSSWSTCWGLVIHLSALPFPPTGNTVWFSSKAHDPAWLSGVNDYHF